MNILYSDDPTDNAPGAPGARVAQLLAQRVGDTVARLHLSGNRPPRLFSKDDGARGEGAPSGVGTLVARKPVSRATPEKDPGALTTDLSSGALPSRTQLMVAPRSSRGTSADVHATERLALTTRAPTLVVHEPARIANAAERFDADIVCLAQAERPTFLTRLFGSEIRRILTKARRSLLIVRPMPA